MGDMASSAFVMQAVREIWALAPGVERRARTLTLARLLNAGDSNLSSSSIAPERAVQLLRLLVAEYDEIGQWETSVAIFDHFTRLDLGHPDIGKAIVEMVLAGCRQLELELGWPPPCFDCLDQARRTQLATELAHILDTDEDMERREGAATWLGHGRWPEGVPALRRALRENHFQLRREALFALCQPGLPAADDVLFVVEELAAGRVLPEEHGAIEYEDVVADLLRLVAPPAGAQVLEPLVDVAVPPSSGRTSGWALGLLAAGYPHAAVPHIDRRLAHRDVQLRRDGAHAAYELPRALAEPRLRRLAEADADAEITEFATRVLKGYDEHGWPW